MCGSSGSTPLLLKFSTTAALTKLRPHRIRRIPRCADTSRSIAFRNKRRRPCAIHLSPIYIHSPNSKSFCLERTSCSAKVFGYSQAKAADEGSHFIFVFCSANSRTQLPYTYIGVGGHDATSAISLAGCWPGYIVGAVDGRLRGR